MATLPAGITVFGPIALPQGARRFGFLSAIVDWPATNTGIIATVTLELSVDSGASWRQAARFEYTGGLDPRTGLPPSGPHPTYSAGAPLPAGVLGRVTVDLAQSLTGTGVIEVA